MSAEIPQWISVEVPVETSSDISVYDGIPIINKIDFGFYVVPGKHDIVRYIQSVDNGDFGPHFHSNVSGYLSSASYISSQSASILSDPYAYDSEYAYPLSTCEYRDSMSAALSTSGDFYGIVDRNCSLEPYVDKIYWTINADSVYTFPNNVIWERG